MTRYDIIYLLTAIGLPLGGSSTVHIYTQTVHRTTQSTQTIHRTTQSTQTIHRTTQSTQTIYRTTQSTQIIHRTTQLANWEECGPCPVFASYTLAFALQLRKKHGKTSVRVAEECQLARRKQNIQNIIYRTEYTEHNIQNRIYRTEHYQDCEDKTFFFWPSHAEYICPAGRTLHVFVYCITPPYIPTQID